MPLLQNNAEGGTNGVTPTTSDTGSGDPFNLVFGSVVYSSAQAAKGSLSYLANPASLFQGLVRWNVTAAATCVFRAYIYLTQLGTDTVPIVRFRASTTTLAELRVVGSTQIGVYNAAGAQVFVAPALSLNTWYRVEVALTVGNPTGALTLRIYANDSTTSISAYDANLTGQDFGSTNVDRVELGAIGAVSSPPNLHFDDVAHQDGTLTLLGPSEESEPAAPTRPLELVGAINAAAGTSGLGFAGACNAYAGTTGLEAVGALNAANGSTGLGLAAVLNELAGTEGLEAQAAANQLPPAA